MRSILIVDDEPDMLVVLEKLLRERFAEVEIRTAHDGLRALEMMGDELPDVVISDFRMPVMTGEEFLRQAKAEFGTIPAMMLTAYPDAEMAVDAAREGLIRRFYTKPPDLQKIIDGVAELLIGD